MEESALKPLRIVPLQDFERILKIAVEYVIGWDSAAGAPLKNRGVWGTPRGHLRIVEEQFRLTLHSHHLIWLHGHQNLEKQLKAAQQLSTVKVHMQNISNSDGKHEVFQFI